MPPFPDRIYSKRIIGGKLRYREELIFREVCHGNRSLQDHTVKRKDRFRQPAANRGDSWSAEAEKSNHFSGIGILEEQLFLTPAKQPFRRSDLSDLKTLQL